MFDDHKPQGAPGAPPQNLPVGEPEDIFAGTDAPLGDVPPAAQPPAPPTSSVEPPRQDKPPAVPTPTNTAPTALAAGALKPKAQPPAPPTPGAQAASALGVAPPPTPGAGPAAPQPPQPPQPPQGKPSYKVQGPSFLRTALMIGIFLVVIAAVIGGGYWVYATFVKDDAPAPPTTQTAPPPVVDDAPSVTPTSSAETPALEEPTVSADDQILFGDVIDSDGDGLDDEQERNVGTDPQNWDTDGDELSDYDEVAVWKTDPFSIDSDGDSYLDGEEVKNGYNPSGSGRIFEPPAPETDPTDLDNPAESGASPDGGRPAGSAQAPETETPAVPQPTVIAGDGIACGGDGECFLAAAPQCQKATHMRTTVLDLWDTLGVRQHVTHYLQILGYNDAGLCEWYMRVDDVDVAFKDDVGEDIQKENRRLLEQAIGSDGTCRMTSAELAALIQKWNNGGYDANDLKAPACQGAVFSN